MSCRNDDIWLPRPRHKRYSKFVLLSFGFFSESDMGSSCLVLRTGGEPSAEAHVVKELRIPGNSKCKITSQEADSTVRLTMATHSAEVLNPTSWNNLTTITQNRLLPNPCITKTEIANVFCFAFHHQLLW